MIKLIDLHKSFGDQVVLHGLNLEIPKGKVTVILGPSGAGKTVILRHMIGLSKPDRGQVWLDDVEISALSEQALSRVRKRFGMLFQSGALFDSLTVEENVAFPLMEHTQLSREAVAKKVREKLSLVGLQEAGAKLPAELSGGMRKRVGLARAIALEPEIILYDEPTTGLDPLMTETINQLILDMQRQLAVTSVIISHDIESTFLVADRVAMLYQGRIVAEGTPQDLQRSPLPFVQEFLHRGKR